MGSPSVRIQIQGQDSSGEAFRKARESAELLGQTIGVKLDRNLRSVLGSFEAVQKVASVAFPVLAAIGFISYAKEIGEQIKKAALELGGFGQALQKLNEQLVADNERILTSFKTIAQGMRIIQQLNDEIAKSSKEQETKTKSTFVEGIIAGLRGGIATTTIEYEKQTEQVEKTVKLEDLRVKALQQLTKLQEDLNKKNAEDAKQAQADLERRLKLLDEFKKKAFESLKTQTPDFSFGTTSGISQLPQVLGGENFGFIPPDVQQQMITFPDKIAKHLESLKNQIDSIHESWHSFGQTIAETIESAALFGRSWTDALKSILLAFVQLLAQVYLFKGISSQFGGGILGSFLGGLAGFKAEGGSVSAGNVYMVGEKGPELFVPNTSGNIVPHGAGMGSVIYNIDARGSTMSKEEFRRVIEQSNKETLSRSVSMNRELALRSA